MDGLLPETHVKPDITYEQYLRIRAIALIASQSAKRILGQHDVQSPFSNTPAFRRLLALVVHVSNELEEWKLSQDDFSFKCSRLRWALHHFCWLLHLEMSNIEEPFNFDVTSVALRTDSLQLLLLSVEKAFCCGGSLHFQQPSGENQAEFEEIATSDSAIPKLENDLPEHLCLHIQQPPKRGSISDQSADSEESISDQSNDSEECFSTHSELHPHFQQPPKRGSIYDQSDDPEESLSTHSQIDCPVCLNRVERANFVSGKLVEQCNHNANMCKKCLSSTLSAQLDTKMWNQLRCPSCSSPIDSTAAEKWLPPKLVVRYHRFMVAYTMKDEPRFRLCMRKGCINGQIHEAGEAEPLMTCGECQYKMCYVHERPWHEGYTCSQYDKYRRSRAGDNKASQKLIKRITKPCPQCQVPIERSRGCDHMTCMYAWLVCSPADLRRFSLRARILLDLSGKLSNDQVPRQYQTSHVLSVSLQHSDGTNLAESSYIPWDLTGVGYWFIEYLHLESAKQVMSGMLAQMMPCQDLFVVPTT